MQSACHADSSGGLRCFSSVPRCKHGMRRSGSGREQGQLAGSVEVIAGRATHSSTG